MQTNMLLVFLTVVFTSTGSKCTFRVSRRHWSCICINMQICFTKHKPSTHHKRMTEQKTKHVDGKREEEHDMKNYRTALDNQQILGQVEFKEI